MAWLAFFVALGVDPPPADPIAFSWEAPAECPQAQVVRDAITRDLHGRATFADRARVRVVREADGAYRADVVVDSGGARGERGFTDVDCATLAETAAFLVVYMATAQGPVPATEETLLAGAFVESHVEDPVAEAGERVRRRRAMAVDPERVAIMKMAPAKPPLRTRMVDVRRRLSFEVRALFSQIGTGSGSLSGRMGGGSVELGHTFRRVSWAVSGTLLGGETGTPGGNSRLSMLGGGGLTMGIGRLGLVRHGMIDLRWGYDVLGAKVVEDRVGDAMQAPTGSLAVHGPRAHLVLRLLGTRNPDRERHHGAGAVIGYQLLLGGLRGDVPPTHVLQVGLSYWFG